MQVMADCGVLELIGVADNGVKIAFRRRDKVHVVHKDDSGKIIPSPYTVLQERSCEHYPCRT